MVGHDPGTEQYFENFTPTYSLKKYGDVIAFLRADAAPGSSLLDVGCASGRLLRALADETPIVDISGMDISRAYLDQCLARVPSCRTYLGSVVDTNAISTIGRGFTYVVVGAVLHHLVGRTRAESLNYAREGLANSWSLVEPGGALIIEEPTYRPRWLMSALFYTKRFVSSVVSGRVSLFGHNNNLGEPVVSYLSHEVLAQEAGALPGAVLVLEKRTPRKLTLAWRLIGVRERSGSLLILRKTA
jgi:SAM-dependent methyltransferase